MPLTYNDPDPAFTEMLQHSSTLEASTCVKQHTFCQKAIKKESMEARLTSGLQWDMFCTGPPRSFWEPDRAWWPGKCTINK